MDLKLFSDNIRSGGKQYTYEDYINELLTDMDMTYKEGSLPSLAEIQDSLVRATTANELLPALSNYLVAISGLSANGEPIEFSEAYTWEDDEIITKEKLQKIEDKLRVALTKPEMLSTGTNIALYRCLQIIQEGLKSTGSITVPSYISSLTEASICHDLGQLKTYYSDIANKGPDNEPYISITNESLGIVEPRGVFSIYLLPTSRGAVEDMSFSPEYYDESGEYRLSSDSNDFDFEGLELILEILLMRDSQNFKKFTCELTYSNETGLYSGSGERSCTYDYTCSFDPKTCACTISFSYSGDVLGGYGVFGAEIMPKNKSYIPSTYYNGFIPLGSNKKYIIDNLWARVHSSEMICENIYYLPGEK